MVWYSDLFLNFPQFVVIHTVKGFGVVSKAEVDVFLELSCFFDDPTDIDYLISGRLPGGSDGKASAYNAGDLGLIPGSGRSSGEGNGNPLQYSFLENSMDWRSLVGYSPWSHKELNMIE